MKKAPYLLFYLASCMLLSSSLSAEKTKITDVPEWSKNVIWYQILVDRFRNGDTSNDPRPEDVDGSYPGFVPEGWKVTPWTQDWYASDSYFSELDGKIDLGGGEITSFPQKAQLRRYGGDLQGVLDKLDYLQELGVTAIYFNPLNDAPSLHKFDARNWRHIDRNFGPDPAGDVELMAAETPDDPSTWVMTAADKMFLKVIEACHKRGIRIIVDYSWNHTGIKCWAIQDVMEKGKASKFADWYDIKSWDDPATPENEFEYKGWAGVPDLPETKETVDEDHTIVHAYEGNLLSEGLKQHIFAITRRWLDPNGDGDFSDGIDGYRMDVAGEVGLEFWREFRNAVRKTNPDAYIVGEIWWEEWPDKLLDPKPFLEGDVFDAVMNYRWFRSARHFFAQAPDKKPVSTFVEELNGFMSNLRQQNSYAMMNVSSSHDVPRLSTALYNKNAYKFHSTPMAGKGYKIDKPDVETLETQKLLLIQQFTYIGSPQIWAGDEMGMWGADDPDCRKPLIWQDLEFEAESTHPLGDARPVNPVEFDNELFGFYQQLCKIRKENPVLSFGAIEYLLVDDENETLAYKRSNDDESIIAVFNTSSAEQAVAIESVAVGETTLSCAFSGKIVKTDDNGTLQLKLPARTAVILISQ